MPISGDQQLDRNQTGFGLPSDTCCVGDGGPSPTEAVAISKGGGRANGSLPAQTLTGGFPPKYTVPGDKTGAPKSFDNVPVGYDGPLGCAGADYNKNLDQRQA